MGSSVQFAAAVGGAWQGLGARAADGSSGGPRKDLLQRLGKKYLLILRPVHEK